MSCSLLVHVVFWESVRGGGLLDGALRDKLKKFRNEGECE